MRTKRESGFTLAEVLVAVTVMAIVFVVVFTLYDNLQKSFKMNENAANQQQNTRVAFDRLVADLRMAGFNYNPDGDPNRPDEQIEGMWGTAVTVRGDFDFEDASARTSPEATLGGSGMTFRTVSTGNDEIVTYALGKPDGSGGASISFVADVVGVPRNGSQETVSIANVHTAQSTPPYTLYRYIVSPNSTTVVRQPVADNIKSLTFTYYSGAIDPNTGAPTTLGAIGGADDPNSLAVRGQINKIGVEVVGMTEDPDLAYIDPTDPNAATRHFRKYTLKTDVTPRNLDMVGVVDIDLDDPNAPGNLTACQGHCNGTYLKWTHPGDPDVASYTVSWGTSAANLINVISTTDMNYYISGITGPHYYAARTIDMTGNQSNNALVGPSTPADSTVPAQTTGLAATGDAGAVRAAVKNDINLAWAGISGNTTNLSCDESPWPIRDLKGYRVYKGATSGFDPNISTQVLQSWDPNSVPYTVNALTDSNIVNCRTYYYKVRGEDLCAVQGAVSSATDGASTTNVPPLAPAAVQATDMGLGMHRITWQTVTEDTSLPAENILIDKYAVYRATVPTGIDPNTATYNQVYSGFVASPSAPYWEDPNVPNPPPLNTYYYRISAKDDCLNNESALSLPDQADMCNFGGSVSLSISPGGSPLTGNQTITLSVSGAPVQATQLYVRDVATGTVVFSGSDNTAPYTYTWNASTAPAGRSYEVVGLVTNTSGCTTSTSTTVATAAVIACCISTNNPNLSPTTGTLKSNELYFDIINNCGDAVSIEDMVIFFTNSRAQGSLLDRLTYNVLASLSSTRTYNFSPDQPSGVLYNFTTAPLSPPLELSKYNDGTNPVRLGYFFTQPMLAKVGSVWYGESIRTEFYYSMASTPGLGRCSLSVVTNPLSIVACDPASDPNCGI